MLIGFDMRRVNDRANWHEDHPCPQKDPYGRFLLAFPHIAREARELGLEILNATPESAISQFPIVKLEEVI